MLHLARLEKVAGSPKEKERGKDNSKENASTVARVLTAFATAGATKEKEKVKVTAKDTTMEKEMPGMVMAAGSRKARGKASTHSTTMRLRRSRNH